MAERLDSKKEISQWLVTMVKFGWQIKVLEIKHMWHYAHKRVISTYSEIFEVDGKGGLGSHSTNYIIVSWEFSFVLIYFCMILCVCTHIKGHKQAGLFLKRERTETLLCFSCCWEGREEKDREEREGRRNWKKLSYHVSPQIGGNMSCMKVE